MIRKRLACSAGFALAASALALAAGTVAAPGAGAQSLPQQCYTTSGGPGCDYCAGSCPGPGYLCCPGGRD